jgi:hypothetical protein
MRYLQRGAATVFSLSAGALILFLAVKDTKPSGSAVVPILVGALGASVLIWLMAEVMKRRAHQTDDQPRNPEIRNPEMNYLLRRLFYEHKGRKTILDEAVAQGGTPGEPPPGGGRGGAGGSGSIGGEAGGTGGT